jgi:DNA-binding beta-propeller fold protein YncE
MDGAVRFANGVLERARGWACVAALSAACSSPAKSHVVLVSQAASHSLAAVDPVDGTTQRLAVGELPHRLVLTRDKRTAYAVLVGSQAVAEVDTAALGVTRNLLTAPVPATREDGSVIEEHLAENAFAQSSCFACHNPSGVKPFVVGERPVGIALSEDESHLYISHIRGPRLSVIDLASGALETSFVLEPAGTAVEAADLARVGNVLAVALRPKQPSTDGGVVRFLDIDTFDVIREVPTGSDPASMLALPDRASVLVSNFETNTATEVPINGDPRPFVVTPGPLGSSLLGGGGSTLTLDYYSNAASIVDLGTGRVDTFDLALRGRAFVNPTHAALSLDGQEAYVVSSGTDGHLLALDLASRTVRAAFPIDGLSFDAVVIPR